MYKQIYESAVGQYRVPADIPATILGYLTYNEYLLAPPRLYGEEVDRLTGMWVAPTQTRSGTGVIHLGVWTRQVRWPGWGLMSYLFDAVSGAFLGRQDGLPGGYYAGEMYQMPDGSVWAPNVLGAITELDLTAFGLGVSVTPATIPWSDYGQPGWSPGPFMVYKAVNRVIVKKNGPNEHLEVRRYDTGEILHTFDVGGIPEAIVGVDGRRAYVLNKNGILNLIDYEVGRVVAATRSPITDDGANGFVLAWDRFYNRLLGCVKTANLSDGSCTIVVKGYYPVPLARGMSKPIPLTPLRKGRQSSVLVRLWGDAGEPITNQVSATVVDAARLLQSIAVSDGQGDALLKVEGLAEGTTTVTANTEIPDPVQIANDPTS